MTPELKRALFPLSGPRWMVLAWWPVHVCCAAIDGYFEGLKGSLRIVE